jgi:hypothetical protein
MTASFFFSKIEINNMLIVFMLDITLIIVFHLGEVGNNTVRYVSIQNIEHSVKIKTQICVLY